MYLVGLQNDTRSIQYEIQFPVYNFVPECSLLGAFAKLWEASISFVVSVRPHGTTRLPLDGFSWYLLFEYFSEICRGNSSSIKISQEWRELTLRPVHIFFVISRLVLLRMKNVVDKICRENRNTHFMFRNFFFSENLAVFDSVEKYCRARQVGMLDTCYKHTLRICNTFWFSTAAAVAPQCHIIRTLPVFSFVACFQYYCNLHPKSGLAGGVTNSVV